MTSTSTQPRVHPEADKVAINDQSSLVSTALQGLQTATGLLAGLAGGSGAPGLQSGLSALSAVLKMVEQSRTNIKGVVALVRRVDDLIEVVKKYADKSEAEVPEGMTERIANTTALWEQITKDAEQLKLRNSFSRVLFSKMDADKLNDLVERLSGSLQDFQLQGLVSQEFALQRTSLGVSKLSRWSNLRSLEEYIARDARHDSHGRTTCLDGTRTDILDQIYDWGGDMMNKENQVTDDASQVRAKPRSVFWLNGLAGSGKSTISSTVCAQWSREGVLGASFFCSRDDAGRNSIRRIVPTLAYQLQLRDSYFANRIAETLSEDPIILDSYFTTQLEDLIIKPLLDLRTSFSPCIIVIDGLDECVEADSAKTVLDPLLSRIKDGTLPSIYFFITSRPEGVISKAFDCYGSLCERRSLHDLSAAIVWNDIFRYLSASLIEIKSSGMFTFSDADLWPNQKDVERLTDISHGSFIYATTAVRFIADGDYCDPEGQLGELVSSTLSSDVSHQILDDLYRRVLAVAFRKISTNLALWLRKVLGAIILLQKPLPPRDLADLLKIPVHTIYNCLSRLHSVLIVPDGNDRKIGAKDVYNPPTIRIIHPTFAQFLLSEARCKDPNLMIDSTEHHTFLLRACLKQIAESSALAGDFIGYIPRSVQYACHHWLDHFHHADISDSTLMDQLLLAFSDERGRSWAEFCSRTMKQTISIRPSLSSARRKVKLHHENRGVIRLLGHLQAICDVPIYHGPSGALKSDKMDLLLSSLATEITFQRRRTVSLPHSTTGRSQSATTYL